MEILEPPIQQGQHLLLKLDTGGGSGNGGPEKMKAGLRLEQDPALWRDALDEGRQRERERERKPGVTRNDGTVNSTEW